MKRTSGFTLIELLVVIAIIGILSSVVLASLNTARTRGNDSSVKANVDTIATQSSLYYDENGNTYGTDSNACNAGLFSNTTVGNALASADTANGEAGDYTCYADDQTYAVSVARPAGRATAFWCTDSAGTKCGIDTDITGSSCGVCVSGD